MAIIPPAYPSWQTANMGLTIDFDQIRYLCLNIPECTGDIELTITDSNKTISEKLVNKYFETYPLQKKDKTIQLNNKPKTIKL